MPKKSKTKYTDYAFDFFDTVAVITGYEDNEAEFKATIDELYDILRNCHQQYNIYLSYEGVNNLLAINKVDKASGQHNRVPVAQETWDMLKFSKYIYDLTDGKTNVAMGSVLSLWHKAREYGADNPSKAYLPDRNELLAASEHVDFEKIEFDESTRSIFISDPEQSIDAGAVAKGYAIELMAKHLEEKGKTGYCLNVGGNIRTIGKRGDGAKWGVGLENPLADTVNGNGEDIYISVLELVDKAMATSGSYQRYYTVDGVQYHHIIDPVSLMPENRWLSVSIVCNDAGMADGLSTALFNMSFEEGSALIESLDDVEAIWMTPEGTIKKSSGFSQYERQ
ncbi:MAG: FAD:protein FMN transferase [Lachnospiraceae bacterium]|nr:FAD:protein FMN transferase [Lachnospiraceae bacterium]